MRILICSASYFTYKPNIGSANGAPTPSLLRIWEPTQNLNLRFTTSDDAKGLDARRTPNLAWAKANVAQLGTLPVEGCLDQL